MALPQRPNFGNAGPAETTTPRPTGGLPSRPSAPAVSPAEQFDLEDDLAVDNTATDDSWDLPPAVGGNAWDSENDYDDDGYEQSTFDEGDYDDSDDILIEQELASLPESIQESVDDLLTEILSDDSSEVIMNGPNSIHCKRKGQRVHLTDIDFGDAATYHRVIDTFILEYTSTHDRISGTKALIEGQLELEDPNSPGSPPMVARVHVMAPPAVKHAMVTIAKKARRQFTLEDIYNTGAMSIPMFEFLKCVAQGKVTTVFSGLSGSGKTTIMEAMSYFFDPDDRVIVAEDTPELRFPLADVVYMVSSKPRPGEAVNKKYVSLDWLVAQANRMRPDRIIVGETRGEEMSEFLIAANSGADGSMTTLHADDPERAWEKMVLLASMGNSTRTELAITRTVANTVQIIVQMGLIDGQHIITHISEVSNVVSSQSGKIALNPLFEYDRRTGKWIPGGRPSEDLKSFMAARGVQMQMNWFQR